MAGLFTAEVIGKRQHRAVDTPRADAPFISRSGSNIK